MTKTEIIRIAQRGIHDAVGSSNYGIATYRYPSRTHVMRQIREIKHERKMLLTPVEAYQLYAAAIAVCKIPGDAAEVVFSEVLRLS